MSARLALIGISFALATALPGCVDDNATAEEQRSLSASLTLEELQDYHPPRAVQVTTAEIENHSALNELFTQYRQNPGVLPTLQPFDYDEGQRIIGEIQQRSEHTWISPSFVVIEHEGRFFSLRANPAVLDGHGEL